MSTLAEIEMALPQFSADELAVFEEAIRKARREK